MKKDNEIKYPFVWIAIIYTVMFTGALVYASWQNEEVRISILTFLNVILGG